jgi:hypothetical protein
MRKLLLFLTLFMSFSFTVMAGYVIRGIPITPPSDDLKNYTLTFDQNDEPISAASMHTTLAPGTGKNSIVIVQANFSGAYLFPIMLVYDPNLPNDLVIRDFHYDWDNDNYVLCGSRQLGSVTSAFVAVINATFTLMKFFEYTGADMFYSICNPNPPSPIPAFSQYYLCGTKSNHGVIASVDIGTLQLTNLYTTTTEWEYHKIIVKYNAYIAPSFVASGRTPDCDTIGFTALNSLFTPINSYMWEQNTDPKSHCVVSDDVLVNNTVILASSYQNVVTLNSVTYPIILPTIRAFRFSSPSSIHYYVQDIGTLRLPNNIFRISVAGFIRSPWVLPVQSMAWHGYLQNLADPLKNNIYNSSTGPVSGDYEHYKIRHQLGNEFTGGYFQNINEMCALFGTPLTASDCDIHYESDEPELQYIHWAPFTLQQEEIPHSPEIGYQSNTLDMLLVHECPIFKGEAPAPELIMAPEKESEIITFYDRITVKDTPTNTKYQIFSIQGQLIQSGATNPDISTAQLSKGIYILRLENGKAFKFLK